MNNCVPHIIEEDAHGVREIMLNSHHLMKRRIFLDGQIDTESAMAFLSELLYLEESNEPVSLIINSPGGEINAGLLIYDALQATPLEVNIYCTGMAASMAAVLLAGGKQGHRFILPHSKVMIHEPLIAGGLGGSATSIRNISESILETKDLMNGILARHTGKTPEEINEATSFDNYMNAETAVEFGICDDIVFRVA